MICFALAAADVDAGQSIPGDAGDYFFGKKFLPKEPAKEREMRLKELENGRLAMVAFGGICTQAALFSVCRVTHTHIPHVSEIMQSEDTVHHPIIL